MTSLERTMEDMIGWILGGSLLLEGYLRIGSATVLDLNGLGRMVAVVQSLDRTWVTG